MAAPGEAAPTFLAAYGQWMQTPLPTWEDVAWLAEQWGGPVMFKGITRIDDAKLAVDAGLTAISVSNHGGDNLDGTPAAIRALPAVADALGARAVMIGRAYLWGLAANGQAGVENVLDILRGGIDSAIVGLGHSSVHDLRPSDLVIRDGFPRTLGAQPRR